MTPAAGKRKPGWSRALGYRIEYLLMRGLIAVLGRVPVRYNLALGRGIGSVCHRLFPFRRALALENLNTAFPQMSLQQREQLLGRVYEHSVAQISEWAPVCSTPHASNSMHQCKKPRRTLDCVPELLAQGRGLILATGHIGNWEWMGAWFAQAGNRLGVVYKPMHNPLTDRLMARMRLRSGLTLFSTRNKTPREMIAHLKRGGYLAFLSDQDAGRRGEFIPFFGKPASTAMGMAWLAVKYGVPILPLACLRTGPGRFTLRHGEPILTNPQAPDPLEEQRRVMQAYHQALEAMIRQGTRTVFLVAPALEDTAPGLLPSRPWPKPPALAQATGSKA